MLSSAVHNCSQTGAHLSPRGRLFSMPVSARPPFKPALCKSLCNFGQIYTETYRAASFFSLPPSFPSLPGYARITSLTPPPLWPQPLNPPPGTIPTSFPLGLLRSCGLFGGSNKLTRKEKNIKNRSREPSDLITVALYWKTWFGFWCSPYRALKKARRPVSGDGWAISFWIWKESRFIYHFYESAWSYVERIAGAENEECNHSFDPTVGFLSQDVNQTVPRLYKLLDINETSKPLNKPKPKLRNLNLHVSGSLCGSYRICEASTTQ